MAASFFGGGGGMFQLHFTMLRGAGQGKERRKKDPLERPGTGASMGLWSYWPDLNRRPADYESLGADCLALVAQGIYGIASIFPAPFPAWNTLDVTAAGVRSIGIS